MGEFWKKVEILRWDDSRYYHQCRINQTLHLASAISFVAAYVLMFVDPASAALVGWLVGMITRQSGHIFFEPRGFDSIHGVSYQQKESIKVGYNMRRKSVLIGVWLCLPALLLASPSLFGLIESAAGWQGYARDVALSWLALGIGGLLFRTVHLFFRNGAREGLACATKILTDPFHDVMLYWRAPLHLLKGELLDPMEHVRGH